MGHFTGIRCLLECQFFIPPRSACFVKIIRNRFLRTGEFHAVSLPVNIQILHMTGLTHSYIKRRYPCCPQPQLRPASRYCHTLSGGRCCHRIDKIVHAVGVSALLDQVILEFHKVYVTSTSKVLTVVHGKSEFSIYPGAIGSVTINPYFSSM